MGIGIYTGFYTGRVWVFFLNKTRTRLGPASDFFFLNPYPTLFLIGPGKTRPIRVEWNRVPADRVKIVIPKDDPFLKWLEKMKGDSNKRNRNKYCRFYKDHGHDTDKCFDLKQQIENFIRQGKLRNFFGRDHKDEKLKGKLEESL